MNPHDTPSQVAVAFAGGAGHATHDDVPQLATLELLTQTPPQLWNPALHVKPHETPSHVADELAGGVHATHELVPQLFVLVLLTHTPAQLWKPALQAQPHETPLHVTVEFAGPAGHATHDDVPHEFTLELLTHTPAQLWKPALQVKPQTAAVQVAVAFAGVGHTVEHAPQRVGLVCRSTQAPPQFASPGPHPVTHWYAPATSWQTGVPPLHTLKQTPQLLVVLRSTSQPSADRPLQSARYVLQVYPHETPLHVDVELAGVGHVTHDTAPQLETELFDTHAPAHRWKPPLHAKPHETPSQVAVAFAGALHAVHDEPQLLVLLLLTHTPAQRW